ncbi:hypothetical protein V2G26_005925 [Clonostachys chloroleuca]
MEHYGEGSSGARWPLCHGGFLICAFIMFIILSAPFEHHCTALATDAWRDGSRMPEGKMSAENAYKSKQSYGRPLATNISEGTASDRQISRMRNSSYYCELGMILVAAVSRQATTAAPQNKTG